MPQTIVLSMKENVDFAFSLVEKFIEVCPEKIWILRFGRWPIAQQIYHALSAVDFFIRDAQGKHLMDNPFPVVADLNVIADELPNQLQTAALLLQAKKALDHYTGSLSDELLGQKDAGASQRRGRDVTYANIMMLLAAHTLYHLGSCDAALREHGLNGVF
jgi:uncharacterized damage-inducible protein DinB